MSLVAAYSDSESESESDGEDGENESHANVLFGSNNIQEVVTNVKSSSILPTTKEEISELFQIEGDCIKDNVKKKESDNAGSGLFSILPQPKAKKCELVEESEDEFMKKTMDIPPFVETCNEMEKPLQRTFLNLPKPSRRKKQPVKIIIPTLEEIGADSDSDEEESKKSNGKSPIKKKSTLFSLLPKPRHSVTVGTNKNKVFSAEANRPLVPHTLTKKKEHSIKNESNKKKKEERKPLVAEFSGSDDDDDIESSANFFSLGNSNNHVHAESIENLHERTSVVIKDHIEHTPDNEENDVALINKKLPLPNNKGNSFFSNLYKSDSNIKTESVILKKNKDTNSINTENNTSSESSDLVTYSSAPTDSTENQMYDKPTPYSNVTAPYSDVTAPYSDVTAPYSDVTAPYSDVTAPYSDVTAPYSDVTAPYSNVTAPYSSVTAPYGNVTAPYGNVPGSYENVTGSRSARNSGAREISTAGSSGNHEKTYPTSQHFFTYAYHKDESSDQLPETVEGSSEVDYYLKPNEDLPIDKDALKALQGNKRSKEDINLIDIRAVDIQANNTDYLKNLTTESPEYQKLKSQKDKDQPTSGQKRKHQITYLAFQAKERELQLQQAWAESYATKRQTQSKYGF